MCSVQFTIIVLVLVILFIVLRCHHKSQENFIKYKSMPSSYPFQYEKLFAGHNNQLDWVKKGIRPGNSPYRNRS